MSKFGNNKRPWFKKKNSHINLLVNAASNYCNEPKFDSYGYYGFKLYFPDEGRYMPYAILYVHFIRNFYMKMMLKMNLCLNVCSISKILLNIIAPVSLCQK